MIRSQLANKEFELKRANNYTPDKFNFIHKQPIVSPININPMSHINKVTCTTRTPESGQFVANETKSKEYMEIFSEVKKKLLKLAYVAFNRLRVRQGKPKFKFVIHTRGLLKVHKISQKLPINLRLNKAKESLSKVASTLTIQMNER